MKTNPISLTHRTALAWLGAILLSMSLSNAMAYNRIFALRLYNETASNVTFTITPGTCYQGTGVGYFGGETDRSLSRGPVAPGDYTDIWVARNQEGCDGEAGYFGISPSTYPGEGQSFAFSNDGMMSQIAPTPNGFSGDLTSTVYNNNTEIFYTWTLKNVEARLSGPLDERLTMPRNPIARNSGVWNGGLEDVGNVVSERLEFRRNGFKGMSYSECNFFAFFHAQHVVRLPDQDGHAYFMVTSSDAYLPDDFTLQGYPNGRLTLYKADAVNPVTRLVVNQTGTDGEIVWEHEFNTDSPIGAWNHPCKMDVVGGVLVVSMLDWDSKSFGELCRDGGQREVSSEDALLFYDVRDSEHPKYWGKMTKTELGANKLEDASLIHVGDNWILHVKQKWWHTQKVSPILSEWTYGGAAAESPQQGQFFNSFELYNRPGEVPPSGSANPGEERAIFGNGEGNDEAYGDHVLGGESVSFRQLNFTPPGGSGIINFSPTQTANFLTRINDVYWDAPNLWTINGGLEGDGEITGAHRKDYDAVGVTVVGGMPVFYSPLVYYRDGVFGLGVIGDPNADKIYQIYNPANIALVTPHPDQVVTTLADDGIGSLRRAIGYGGRITFAPSLNNGTIVLENGPLFVYPYDVNIDASSLPFGISIQGRNFETRALIQVMDPNTLTMSSGLRTMGDPLTSALLDVVTVTSTSLPWATGGAESWFSVTPGFFTPTAAKSGVIANSQATYLQSSVSGPGTLTFWWKVSSEWNFDFLRFTIDGVETAAAPAISGEVGWRQKTVTVPAGSHTLRWTYSKNGSGLDGSDAGWLDQVVFEPVRPEISIEQPVGTPLEVYATVDFGIQLSGSPTTPKTFTIKNTGGVQLNISDVSIDGGQASEFTVNTAGMLTSIPPASQTTFTVTFTPGALGARLDFLQVLSDDPDEGSLLFLLTGTGVAVGPPSLPVAVDAPALVWTTSGNSVWNGQAATTHDGVDAAQSGAIGNSQTSVLATTITGPGTLTFWWKVSSEVNFDFLRFQMDGVETAAVPAISGEVNWVQKTVSVPAGSHTLSWTYSKDYSTSAGSDAAWLDQVVLTPVPPSITSPLTASGTLGEPFNYQIAASNTPTSYNATGLPAGVTVDTSTGLISGTPTVGGNFTVTLTATNAGGSGTATLTLSIATLAPALDAPGLLWETSYSYTAWFGQLVITHDGVDAAQSGPISNNQGGYVRTTVAGPGTLTFWWKVSSEAGGDFMRFRIDGLEQAAAPEISGEVDWVQKTVTVPAGSHTLMWTYGKNESVSAGSDAAWLDQVVFTPPQPEIAIEQPVGTPLNNGTIVDFGTQLSGSPTTPKTFTIKNTGDSSLNISGVSTIGVQSGDFTVNTTGMLTSIPAASQTTFTVTFTPGALGGRTGVLQVVSDDADEDYLIFFLTGTGVAVAPPSIPEAVDAPALVWTSGGGASWFGQTVTTHDGVDAAQSGNIEDSGDIEWSFLETTVTGPGTLTFWWKVSSEAGGDFLRFRFIGQEDTIPAISGEVDWVQKTVNVPAGSHTLLWSYSKNESVSAGSDAGWLDQVIFTPSQSEIAIDLPSGSIAVGGVVAWGDNENGQTTVPVAAQSGVTGIAAGYVHTAALKTDGTVVAWGNNSFGETAVPVDLNGVVAIAGTRFHTAALKSNGTVRTWGYGTETTVPPGLNDVRAIAAGFAFTVALKNDGSVVAWGNNSHGQATVPAAALSGVIAIAANDLHALALKSDGSVIAWGNPANGRTTVPVAALTGVIAIAAGGNHSLALKSDGTVVAWGQSSEGQTTVPAGLSGVVAIAAGDFNSAAIKSDGSVVAWGYPDFGVNTVPVAALSNALAIAGGGNHAVALVGTRIVDFGSQPIGVAGPWKTFTIKNTGSAALSITSVSVVGFNSGDFAVDTSGMLASIPAAGQTTFRVLFNAGAPGARPIILRVLNNDADESITDITLTGTGSTTLASLQFGVSGAGTNTLTFVGIPGSQYIAQYATNLSTSPWFDFRTNAAGTNGLWQVIAPNATNVQRFYRVRTP